MPFTPKNPFLAPLVDSHRSATKDEGVEQRRTAPTTPEPPLIITVSAPKPTADSRMGIYDREYYRDGSGPWQWFAGPAPATRTLIALNVAIYLLQILFRLPLQEWLGATSSGILREFRLYELVTASFLHSPRDVFHIIWNMLFLWWFGSELESLLGSREFTLFYLASAVLSTLGWALIDAALGDSRSVMIGASGAVTAVAVVITLLFPNRKILLFFIFPMPLWAFLVLYLGNDAFALLAQIQGAPGSGRAFAAHLTGAACGFLYKQSGIRLQHLRWPRFRPRLRVIVPDRREPVRPRAVSSLHRPESARQSREPASSLLTQEQLDAQLDLVLAKIAREGRDALNEAERRVLDEASRRARQRRGSPS